MKDTTEILKQLRQLIRTYAGTAKLDAYIIPSDDEHQNEYICPSDERRAFVSGFDGSAGTAVVLLDKALLWTDGRYYQQAAKQLDVNWTLMKEGLPTTLSIGAWLAKNLPKGSNVGVDPKLISWRLWKAIQKELKASESNLIPTKNFVDLVWGNAQPKRTSNKIMSLDYAFSGQIVREKWDNIKSQMVEKNTQVLVVSALDEIAWFSNLRGSDIEFNPVFFSYLIITHDDLYLFVDLNKLPDDFDAHQKANEVKIKLCSYDQVDKILSDLTAKNEKVWISPTSSFYLSSLIPKCQCHHEITPIAVNKAIKNDIEVQGFINSHIRDGVALCQYFAWLEDALRRGEYVDELSGSAKLEEFRTKQDHFKGLSFTTISSSGPNGSVIHYHPKEETNRPITEEEIYLCDSGAQYLDGTTDVTRTFHFGTPTDFQKEAYTRVLKGQLNFGSTIFPRKVKGQVLDTLARKALWDVGLDYGHGTGHGVGHFLNVHEGPMGVGIRLMPDDPGLQENMFISNEPGYYKDGEFGIRIEDIVQIVKATCDYNFSDRGALTFNTITMCPKQTKMIKRELLSDSEAKTLNDYHRKVWETISPLLKKVGDELTLTWLKKETASI